MASQEQEVNKKTDGSSIVSFELIYTLDALLTCFQRPVSTLLSHFEALNYTKHSIEPVASTKDTPSKFLHQESAPNTATGRTSLDLPRPYSLWSSPGPRQEEGLPPLSPGGPNHQSLSSPKNGRTRPMSMDFRSTPQLAPSVTINPPSSPPRTTPGSRSGSRSPDRFLATITPGKISSFNKIPVQPSPVQTRHRSARDSPEMRSLDPSKVSKEVTPSQLPPRTSSIPPKVNRAEKPKILSKPEAPLQHERRRLTPEPIETPKKRVSPFSTPPSSEGSPSPERQVLVPSPSPPAAVKNKFPAQANEKTSEINSSRPGQHQRDPRLLGFSGPTGSIGPRDPRSLGFSSTAGTASARDAQNLPVRASTVSERHSKNSTASGDASDSAFPNQKPAHRHVSEQVRAPPPPTIPKLPLSDSSAVLRDPRLSGLSRAGTTVVHEETPVRRAPPPRPPDESKVLPNSRAPLPPPQSFDRSTKPGPLTRKSSVPTVDITSKFPPPLRRTAFEETTSQGQTPVKPNAAVAQSRKVAPKEFFEDSDEADENEEDPPVAISEYPDSSQANRRPPHFHQGAQEIPTKFDSRVFDICGQYVCTTGYVTRVWDLSRGGQIFSLSHGETVKMLSAAFKPGQSLEEEGNRLWIGSNIGELHEIDIPTQAIVATSPVHNRREVIRILRHKKDLWTLDDDGKLFVWRAEEFRMPSLKYSRPSHRVPKGHTFSMTVQDKLWYATGREIRVFRPGDDISFSVLPKPLSQSGTGDVTSGAYSSRQGNRVYLGHADGKVSLYSTGEYVCIGVVKASDYKINAMSFVGDNLWAAYKTGKIYVYDTSSTPWKVKKDWRAHDGPAASMLLDPNGIWTLSRLQVASLGHDNCIRLWDGMLEDDWLESAMQSRDVKYCTFREIRAAVVTWNVGACNPLDIRSDFVSDAINVEDPPEVLVFGFQEIVDLEDRAVTAKSILGFGKKKDKENARSEQHVSRVYREWRDYLGKCINRYMDPRYTYTEVHTSCLIGLFQCIFVRQEEKGSIRNMSATEVKCGMKGHYGNKGALITRFMFDDSSLCFINCHLAAGQTQTSHRNNDIAAILEAESLPAERNPDSRMSFYVGGGDGTQVLDHEICILNGDLNYRIDAIPRDTVINMINKGELEKLLERDQIMVSRRRVSGFRLSPFNEARITFAPTYKYDVGSDRYDSSEKKGSPARCDRLL